MFMVQLGVVPGMPNSIWMLSSEDSSIEQCQINMIESSISYPMLQKHNIVSINECIIIWSSINHYEH